MGLVALKLGQAATELTQGQDSRDVLKGNPGIERKGKDKEATEHNRT
jgi:hypothetical protein